MVPPNDYARYAGLGMTYAGSIVVMGALGYCLDVALDTVPWLMIVGIALGSVGGFLSIVKKVSGSSGTRPGNDSRPES